MPNRLLMLGLWPATPTKPKLAFTLELMDMIHFLVRECQVSLYDITNFLQCIGKKQPQVIIKLHCNNNNNALLQDKAIYKLLTNTFPHYR